MTEDQSNAIKGYMKTLNTTVVDGDLLDLVLDEVVDRVLLYLNADMINERLNRVIARIAVGVYKQTKNGVDSSDSEHAIASVSDNGQSVTYRYVQANYLASLDDNEIFGGFTKLLARYRRVNVHASTK